MTLNVNSINSTVVTLSKLREWRSPSGRRAGLVATIVQCAGAAVVAAFIGTAPPAAAAAVSASQ